MSEALAPLPRRFVLVREADPARPDNPATPPAVIAEGVQFTNGQAVMRWLADLDGLPVMYATIGELTAATDRSGRTHVGWIDHDE